LKTKNRDFITFTILKFVVPSKIYGYSDISWNILVLLRANVTAVSCYSTFRCHSFSLHLFPLVFLTRYYSSSHSRENYMSLKLGHCVHATVDNKASIDQSKHIIQHIIRFIVATQKRCWCEFKWGLLNLDLIEEFRFNHKYKRKFADKQNRTKESHLLSKQKRTVKVPKPACPVLAR